MNDLDGRLKLYRLAKGRRALGDSVEEMLGVSRDTLDAEAKAGRLVVTRIRGRVFVRAENLEQWLKGCDSLPPANGRYGIFPLGLREGRLGRARAVRNRFMGGVR